MLRKLDENLWVIDHEFAMPGGIQIGTRTTVIRLSDGSLFVHALGPADDGDHVEISKLGHVAHAVSPNLFHNEFVEDWASRYEGAKFYAPETFEEKVPSLEGAPVLGEIVFFHPSSRTLLLTDLCFNMVHSDSFITRLVMRIMGGYGHFGPSRLAKSFMKDKSAIRRGIDKILEWDFDRVTVTHGVVLERGGHEKFKQSYAWLKG